MARNHAAQSPDHAILAPPPAASVVAPTQATGPASPDATALPLNPSTGAAQPAPEPKPRSAGPAAREYARCDLCGEALGGHAGHFHMVSPLTARHVSVCRTCRRAALGEGYRPRA
jgi:hypothetical protein